jgi:hypothetical protein
LIFLIRTARHDLQGVIRQRPLQRLVFVPGRPQQLANDELPAFKNN